MDIYRPVVRVVNAADTGFTALAAGFYICANT
jgi:hypothetical protein